MADIRLSLQPERRHDGGTDTDIRHPVRLFTRLLPIQIEWDFLAAKFRTRPGQQITQCLRCKRRAVVTEMVSHQNIARRYAVFHRAGERPQHKQPDTEIFRFILPGHNFARPRLITINQIA